MSREIPWLAEVILTKCEKLDCTWFFRFSGGGMVATESFWRLLALGQIASTSEDHGHVFGLPSPVDAAEKVAKLTAGRKVLSAAIGEPISDLRIAFEGDITIEFIATSAGYESWRAEFASDSVLSSGGGLLISWSKNPPQE